MKKSIISSMSICLLALVSALSAQTSSATTSSETQKEGGEFICKILKDGNSLWIAANSGLLQLDTETGAVTAHELGISDLPRLRNLAKDKDGNLWITTERNGVFRYDGQSVKHYDQNSGLGNSQYCTSIAVDANNNKWIGSLLYLNKFNGDSWQTWTTPLSIVAGYWIIWDLKFDRNGDLWMGGDSPEWHFAKFSGQEIQPVPEIKKAITKILIDEQDNKWLASQYEGLIKYNGSEFVTWNTENSNLPSNDIYDIKQDASGNIWLASNKYLVKFDGREFTGYANPHIANARDFIYSLELDDLGNIWAGTKFSGLFKFVIAQESFQSVSATPTTTITPPTDYTPAVDPADPTVIPDSTIVPDLYTPTSIEYISDGNNNLIVRGIDSKLSVDFVLTDAANISLSVFDLQGREVATLLKNRYLSDGNHQYSVRLTSGIYIVRYTVNDKTVSRKTIVK
jgi:ligand-binding sensor domain-containing protein